MQFNTIEHFAQHMGDAMEAVQEGVNPAEAMYEAIHAYMAEGGKFPTAAVPKQEEKTKASAPNYKKLGTVMAVLAAIALLGGVIALVLGLIAFIF